MAAKRRVTSTIRPCRDGRARPAKPKPSPELPTSIGDGTRPLCHRRRERAAGIPARRLSLSPAASGHFEALKPRNENSLVLKIDRPVAVAARLLSLVSSLHRPFTPEGYSILYSQPV